MNTRILLLAISVVALSSCSSVYRSGQTPDDLYYSSSPARLQANANNSNDNDDSYVDVQQSKDGSNFQSYEEYAENQRDDRFLRMSVGNSYYMDSYNTYSGFDWRYNSFYDGFNYGFGSPWNNYFAWNNFYNPYSSFGSYYGGGLMLGGYFGGGYYGGGYGIGGGVKYPTNIASISRPRVFNVNSYSSNNRPAGRTSVNGNYYNNNQRYNNTNSNGNNGRANNGSYNNSNNGRSMYTPPANTNSNNTYTPSRSYTPSAPSGGGGGGGGGGVSRPSRGH